MMMYLFVMVISYQTNTCPTAHQMMHSWSVHPEWPMRLRPTLRQHYTSTIHKWNYIPQTTGDQTSMCHGPMTHRNDLWNNSRVIPNCGGPNTFMNRRAVEKIHSMARLTDRKGYRIEDIYYNGIIRLKANVSISRARFHSVPTKAILKNLKILIFQSHFQKIFGWLIIESDIFTHVGTFQKLNPAEHFNRDIRNIWLITSRIQCRTLKNSKKK